MNKGKEIKEAQRDLKDKFDQFWDSVGDVVISLIQNDFTSTDVFISNYDFVKERYFAFNGTLSPEDRIWLAENHLGDYVELLQCSTAIASIEATLTMVKKPQPEAVIH